MQDGKTSKSKSTGGFYRPEWSLCTCLFFRDIGVFLGRGGIGVCVDGDAEEDDVVLPALVDLVEAILQKTPNCYD